MELCKQASDTLRLATTINKNKFLLGLADLLLQNIGEIVLENEKDLELAKELPVAMQQRLKLSENSIKSIAKGLKEVAELADPVGTIEKMCRRPNGMQVGRMRVPIGVIFFIFESRPNVIVDAAAMCIKSGNVLLARGGKEAFFSNNVLLKYIKKSLIEAGLPEHSVEQLEDRSHEAIIEVVKMDKFINLVVPRGREKLIQSVKEAARVPVIAHERGLCHLYIDATADVVKAVKLAVNAKTSNPSACNSIETVLVHKDIVNDVLPTLLAQYLDKGVEVRGDKSICDLNDRCILATEEDWSTEYLDLIISIKVVENSDEAITHIKKYSSGLTDSIVTEDYSLARRFTQEINSASVLVNASNRLTDGGQFGLGAELGISTASIHMKGPMGIVDLTVTKYIVLGDGQIRE